MHIERKSDFKPVQKLMTACFNASFGGDFPPTKKKKKKKNQFSF